MLTAKGETADKVSSLGAGADDYLVKPFIFEELIARLQAKLRRPQLIEEQVLRWHEVSINPTTREAWHGRDRLDLTQREFDCSTCSCANRGASSARIICSNWSGDMISRAVRISLRRTSHICERNSTVRAADLVHPHRSRRRVRPLAVRR